MKNQGLKKNSSLKPELKQTGFNIPSSFQKLPEIPTFRQLRTSAPTFDEKRSLNKSSSVSKPKEIKTFISAGKENKYDSHVIDEMYRGPLGDTTDPAKIVSSKRMLKRYINSYPDVRVMVPIIYQFSLTDAQKCQTLLLASTGQLNSAKNDLRVKSLNTLFHQSIPVRFVLAVIVDMFSEIDYKNFCKIMKSIYQYRVEQITGNDQSLLGTTSDLERKLIKSSPHGSHGSQTFPSNPGKPASAPHHSNMHLITNENNHQTARLKRSQSLPNLNSKSSSESLRI